MIISEIRKFPTTYETDGVQCHESLLRSFHIVEKVKELCEKETPPSVIKEMIFEMEMNS